MRYATTTRRQRQRKGAIAVLTAVFIVVIMILAGMLLSLSYIQLARAELQAATDASARAAVVALVDAQSEDAGRQAAVDMANRFMVGGERFSIDPNDVQFGSAARQDDGSFNFVPDEFPTNSARVTSRKTNDAAAGPLNLPLGVFVNSPTYETQTPATAMRLDYDICLVLDRSGSMAWDLSDQRFSYPGLKATRPTLENYFGPPEENSSRWAVLSDAVGELLTILETREVSARVGLVTFASDYAFGRYESEQVTLNSDLTDVFDDIPLALDAIAQKPLIGDTNIAAGLQQAQTLLTTSAQARTRTAHPAIILFSDGIYTEGVDPGPLATQIYQTDGIVIHCVTFGAEDAARNKMDEVAANAGNGYSLHADSAAELVDSFREIANSIPVLITE